jgi:competence protein ComEA
MKHLRRRALLVIGAALLAAAGDHLAHRPPPWLRGDPILEPFGLTTGPAVWNEEAEPPALPPVTPEAPLDINRASARELTALPRVGPVLAGRIVALRDSLGGFTALEQLDEVRGVGPATLERIRPLVRLR